jgi:hypothetical protein
MGATPMSTLDRSPVVLVLVFAVAKPSLRHFSARPPSLLSGPTYFSGSERFVRSDQLSAFDYLFVLGRFGGSDSRRIDYQLRPRN